MRYGMVLSTTCPCILNVLLFSFVFAFHAIRKFKRWKKSEIHSIQCPSISFIIIIHTNPLQSFSFNSNSSIYNWFPCILSGPDVDYFFFVHFVGHWDWLRPPRPNEWNERVIERILCVWESVERQAWNGINKYFYPFIHSINKCLFKYKVRNRINVYTIRTAIYSVEAPPTTLILLFLFGFTMHMCSKAHISKQRKDRVSNNTPH